MSMAVAERQEQIVDLLYKQKSATVVELSALFDVSPVTIRSDLNQMAEQGRIVRTHGGALLAGERTRQEYSFTARQRLHAPQKQRIGQAAAALVQPGEAILLDASTTAFAVGKALKERTDLYNVTVVTTGIWTALELLGSPALEIVLTGGHVRTASGSIAGVIAHDVLGRFYFQKAFLGAWGVTLTEGLMDSPLAEVDLKRTIVSRSQELIAIVDGSKFGRTSLAPYAKLEEATRLICDQSAPRPIIVAMRDLGLSVSVVDG
ncbi:MAG: DeoR/GlpR family DNA-binding transcription regulator [Candidatus Promineifilaceae bacterium]